MMPASAAPNSHLLVISLSTRTNPACYGGLGTLGMAVNDGGVLYVSETEPQVIAHELRHNLGNMHSNSLPCDNAQDGAWTGGVFTGCTSREYDDMFDIMGFGGSAGRHYGIGNLNAVHLDGMGFAPLPGGESGTIKRLRHLHGQDRDVVHHALLAAGTQCAYAVFAHDSVPNHAVAAALAITTAPDVVPQRDSNQRPSD